VFLTFYQQFSFGSTAHVERSDGKDLIKRALDEAKHALKLLAGIRPTALHTL